jgi:hypothetical protein
VAPFVPAILGPQIRVSLLDLLLFKRGRRFGVEIKRMDAPTLTRSMRIAPANLQPSGRAFRFNELGANLFFSLCHSAPFASSKVFEPLLDARDLKWVCVMSMCHLDRGRPRCGLWRTARFRRAIPISAHGDSARRVSSPGRPNDDRLRRRDSLALCCSSVALIC